MTSIRRVRFNEVPQVRVYEMGQVERIDKLRQWYEIHDNINKNRHEMIEEVNDFIHNDIVTTFKEAVTYWRITQCYHIDEIEIEGWAIPIIYGGQFGWIEGYILTDKQVSVTNHGLIIEDA